MEIRIKEVEDEVTDWRHLFSGQFFECTEGMVHLVIEDQEWPHKKRLMYWAKDSMPYLYQDKGDTMVLRLLHAKDVELI